MRLHVVAVAIAITLAAASPRFDHARAAQQASLMPIDDPDAYAVYASLLPNEEITRVFHAKTLVFQQETTTMRQCVPSGPPLETDWRPVVDSFRKENASVRTLRTGFPLGMPYVVISSDDVSASFHEVQNDPLFGWTGFYKRYPDSGGYMSASAVGFNAVKTRAMVYMAHSCGSLCGRGTYHLLEKVDGIWREANTPGLKNCTWVS